MDELKSGKTDINSLLEQYSIDGQLEEQYREICKKLDEISIDFKVLIITWENFLNGNS